MNINERIKEIRKYFCNDSNVKFAKKLSKGVNTTSNYTRNGYSVGGSVANDIIRAFPEVNAAWLLSGEGNMLKNNTPDRQEDRQGIPYYDIDVTASITESFNDSPEMAQYYINYAPLNDCTAAFPVFGDSMLPDFCPGEVVLVKEITNVDSMLWGEPYLVITGAVCDNLRTIKNVYLSSDRQSFILRATNPRFQGDTIVARDNVLKIFLIKGKLNRRQL